MIGSSKLDDMFNPEESIVQRFGGIVSEDVRIPANIHAKFMIGDNATYAIYEDIRGQAFNAADCPDPLVLHFDAIVKLKKRRKDQNFSSSVHL